MQNEEYTIRPIKNINELQMLSRLFAEVFELKGGLNTKLPALRELHRDNYFFALTALEEQQLIGGLTGYLLPSYLSRKPIAYLYDLAVLPPFQNQGVGKGLITYAQKYCRETGAKELFLHADEDEKMIHFYRSTLPDEEQKARIFSYNLS